MSRSKSRSFVHYDEPTTGKAQSIKRRAALAARDGWICHLCRQPIDPASTDGTRPTLDHIKPRSQGGRYSLDNLKLAHHDCNVRRGTNPISDFTARAATARLASDAGPPCAEHQADSVPAREEIVCPGPVERQLRERIYCWLHGHWSPRVVAERLGEYDRVVAANRARLEAWADQERVTTQDRHP